MVTLSSGETLEVLCAGSGAPLVLLLPMMASIRNPNKFLQVFQVGFGVLAAFGLDALLGRTRTTLGPRSGGRVGGSRWAARTSRARSPP